MTSLSSTNPHAKDTKRDILSTKTGRIKAFELSVEDKWRKTLGDAVADDSKSILAVNFDGKCYIMADIRCLVNVAGVPENCVALELFFDGNLKEFGSITLLDKMGAFFAALQVTIDGGVREYFRRKVGQIAEIPHGRSELRNMKFPDTSLSSIGGTIDESFRDAGCMLSFIAVRVFMSTACAECIGGLAFPEDFGMKSKALKDPPIPKWLLGMAVTAGVFGIAMVYAWAQILIYGNSLS